MQGIKRKAMAALSIAFIGALVLSSCSGGQKEGGNEAGSGEGVAFGATQDEYIAAFEGVDQINLDFQAGGSPNASQSWPLENYAKALDEWSGGKIKAEITYGNAIAGPLESDDALADGRLSFASVLSLYEPDKYPVATVMNNIGVTHQGTDVVGMLQGVGAWSEVALGTPELQAEYLDAGIKAALTHSPGANPTILCTQERSTAADLSEKQTRAAGVVHVETARAIGMVPVSLNLDEVYEGLQRGIVDCSIQHLVGAKYSGYLDLTPYVLQDSKAAIASTFTGNGFDAQLWDELPLVAKQLLWDRQDVFQEWTMIAQLTDVLDARQTIEAAGGGISPFDDATRKAVLASNEKMLDQARATDLLDGEDLVKRLQASSDKWLGIVEELGYVEPASTDELAASLDSGELDLKPFVSRWSEEVLQAYRPE